jgi:ribosomal protein S18 acetylase RimI-like enzyme
MLIQRPEPEELDAIRALVQTVVDEVYGGIWAPSPLPIDEERWHLSWVAVVDTKIIGVLLTGEEWLDDLWVLHGNRGRGVGHRLLERGEAEIVARGHQTLRLRVVQSNTAAIKFYLRHGWRIAREFPHEKFSIITVEMFKSVRQDKK